MSDLEQFISALRAAGEDTRMRLLAACATGEWTVSELVQVIGQSQPRVSRHLKLLADAGLLERFREGSWVFYRRANRGEGARIARSLCRLLPVRDDILERDRRRLEAVRDARRRQAEGYFASQAVNWDSERDLGVSEERIEAELVSLFESERASNLLDIGTGTGRILQLLAPQIGFGLGVDNSHDMLGIARANLDRREARNCQVRRGDMYELELPDSAFQAVILHQVLHFADDPGSALREAARVLDGQGRLIIVDLEAHDDEGLRSDKHHRRLGFSDAEMAGWFDELGLSGSHRTLLEGTHHNVIIWGARKTAKPDDGEKNQPVSGGFSSSDRSPTKDVAA